MEEDISKQRHPPSTIANIRLQKQLATPTLNPLWRLSPWHNGSTLYDAYELRAVTHQLNRAVQGSNHSLVSPFNMVSPFCQQRLESMYKENAKPSKRISYCKYACSSQDNRGGLRGNRGIIMRLWKKLKRGFIKN